MPRIRFAPQTRMRSAQGLLVLIFSLRAIRCRQRKSTIGPQEMKGCLYSEPDNATDEEPLESLLAVPTARHRISGQRHPTHKVHAKPLKLRAIPVFRTERQTWPEACTYADEMYFRISRSRRGN